VEHISCRRWAFPDSPLCRDSPQLLDDIQTVFAHAPLAEEIRMEAITGDSDHGRIAQRWLQMSRVLAGYSDWLGLGRVFQMEAR
jgi:hypothetical protein